MCPVTRLLSGVIAYCCNQGNLDRKIFTPLEVKTWPFLDHLYLGTQFSRMPFRIRPHLKYVHACVYIAGQTFSLLLHLKKLESDGHWMSPSCCRRGGQALVGTRVPEPQDPTALIFLKLPHREDIPPAGYESLKSCSISGISPSGVLCCLDHRKFALSRA